MKKIMNFLALADTMILRALKVVTIVTFIMLTILITANVIVRFFPVVSLHWFDEIIELLYAYLVFYGAAALWILRGHISVGDWIEKSIANPRLRHLYRAFIEILVLIFAAVFFYYSLRLTILALDVTNVFAIPKRVLYSCMPIAGALMVIYSLRNIALEFIRMGTPSGGEA
jgi:TRAP-type transport system small permease protein